MQAANLVHQTSTSTGTGNLTLATVNGKQSFDTAFSHGTTEDVFDYFISNHAAAEWERGTGHMSDATTLVRDTVIESSNSDAAVDFSAGTKDVTNAIPADNLVSTDIVSGNTDNGIARYDGTAGKIQSSLVTIDDNNRMKFGPDTVNVTRTNPGIDIAHKSINSTGISLIELLGYANVNTVLQTNELVMFNVSVDPTDSGAFRAVTRQIGSNDGRADSTEGAKIRAAEFHVVRGQGVPKGSTWCLELGMHIACTDAITDPADYAAIFARSNITGWVNGTAQRGGYVIYADGGGGWSGLAYMKDTDSSTVLYDLDKDGLIKCKGGIRPTVSDGAAIGSSSLQFSDAFLASGAVINFNNGNLTLTHASGSLAIGGTPNSYGAAGSSALQIQGTGLASASLTLALFDATASDFPGLQFYRSKNATIGSATVVAQNDVLGAITWYGAQTTSTFSSQSPAARILASVGNGVTSGNSDMPGDIVFQTTPNNSATLADRFRISAEGFIVIGSGSVATSATTGFLAIPACAGTPTGTPSQFTSGRAHLVYDSTNNKLYAYNGAWKGITLS